MCSQPLAPLPEAAAFPQPLRPAPTLESVFTAEICICCKFQQSSSYRFRFPKIFNALGQTRLEAKPGQVLLRAKRPSVSTHAWVPCSGCASIPPCHSIRALGWAVSLCLAEELPFHPKPLYLLYSCMPTLCFCCRCLCPHKAASCWKSWGSGGQGPKPAAVA